MPEHRIRVVAGDPGGRIAKGIVDRHRQLYIGAEIARSILELAADPPGRAAAFAAARTRWEERGGLVEQLPLETVKGWIASPHHLVVEASPAGEEFVPRAQAIFTVPHDGWVMPVPDPALDEIRLPELMDRLLAGGPCATALVDFLTALPGSAGSGLAGTARHRGILELVERHPAVRQVLGASFIVKGLETAAGERIWLAELGQDEVVNRASMRAISRSRRCPAHHLGVRHHAAPLAVDVDGAGHRLLVGWHLFVRLVEEVQPATRQPNAT